MQKSFLYMASLILFAGVILAQTSITGRWQGETRNHSQISLVLTANETALTGTFTLNGETSRIVEGKVSKNAFSFKATIGNQTESFTGELANDQITLWIDRQGPSSAAVLKRVKN